MDKLASSLCVRSRLPAREAASFQGVRTRHSLAGISFDASDPSFAAGARRGASGRASLLRDRSEGLILPAACRVDLNLLHRQPDHTEGTKP